jgi:formiminotetrahydrofolate cyclodeaminase
MATTTTKRPRLTDAERAERVEAMTAELAAAVAAPHRLHWLAVHARSLGPVPPLQLWQERAIRSR